MQTKEAVAERRQTSRRRVLSGIQPSGDLHLGNYLGSIKRWVERQSEKENYFCIVDLHAITAPHDPKLLRHRTRAVAALYIASGLDPDDCTIFVQSHVTAHAEACWILNCVTPVGWLERMTQYKDKSAQTDGGERMSTGLLDYPVLMAGDIVLYSAHEVPVGDDQKSARRAVPATSPQRFNRLYGETFVDARDAVIPEGRRQACHGTQRSREVKMSKSHSHVQGARGEACWMSPKVDRADSIMRAVTDSGNEIVFSEAP